MSYILVQYIVVAEEWQTGVNLRLPVPPDSLQWEKTEDLARSFYQLPHRENSSQISRKAVRLSKVSRNCEGCSWNRREVRYGGVLLKVWCSFKFRHKMKASPVYQSITFSDAHKVSHNAASCSSKKIYNVTQEFPQFLHCHARSYARVRNQLHTRITDTSEWLRLHLGGMKNNQKTRSNDLRFRKCSSLSQMLNIFIFQKKDGSIWPIVCAARVKEWKAVRMLATKVFELSLTKTSRTFDFRQQYMHAVLYSNL